MADLAKTVLTAGEQSYRPLLEDLAKAEPVFAIDIEYALHYAAVRMVLAVRRGQLTETQALNLAKALGDVVRVSMEGDGMISAPNHLALNRRSGS